MSNENLNVKKGTAIDMGLRGFLAYAGTDVVLVWTLTAIALASIFTPVINHSAVRLVLAFVFVLFLPGYSFVAMIYPRKDDLGGIERAVLSAGMSLALVPLTGFAINFSPWSINERTMLLAMSGLIVLFTLLASVRRHRLPQEERFAVDLAGAFRSVRDYLWPRNMAGADRKAAYALGGALLLTLLVTAMAIAIPSPGERFTELYLNGPGGKIGDYPTEFQLGETRPVIVGVANHEGATKTYDIVVTLGDGDNPMRLYAERFVLGGGQRMERMINLSPDRTYLLENVRFSLYMDGARDAPYRQCNLRVNVTSPVTGESRLNSGNVI